MNLDSFNNEIPTFNVEIQSLESQKKEIDAFEKQKTVLWKDKKINKFELKTFNYEIQRYLFILMSLLNPNTEIYNTREKYKELYKKNKSDLIKRLESLNEITPPMIPVHNHKEFYTSLAKQQTILKIQNSVKERISGLDSSDMTTKIENIEDKIRNFLQNSYVEMFEDLRKQFKEKQYGTSETKEYDLCALQIKFLTYYGLLLEAKDPVLIKKTIEKLMPNSTTMILKNMSKENRDFLGIDYLSLYQEDKRDKAYNQLKILIEKQLVSKQEEIIAVGNKLQSAISSNELNIHTVDESVQNLMQQQSFLSSIRFFLTQKPYQSLTNIQSFVPFTYVPTVMPILEKVQSRLTEISSKVEKEIVVTEEESKNLQTVLKTQEAIFQEIMMKIYSAVQNLTIPNTLNSLIEIGQFNQLLYYLKEAIKSPAGNSALHLKEITKFASLLKLNKDKYSNPKQFLFMQDEKFIDLLNREVELLQNKQLIPDSFNRNQLPKSGELEDIKQAIGQYLNILEISTVSPESINMDQLREIFISINEEYESSINEQNDSFQSFWNFITDASKKNTNRKQILEQSINKIEKLIAKRDKYQEEQNKFIRETRITLLENYRILAAHVTAIANFSPEKQKSERELIVQTQVLQSFIVQKEAFRSQIIKVVDNLNVIIEEYIDVG